MAGWNVWLDGSAGYLEDTEELRAYDGSQLSVSLGADTKVNSTIAADIREFDVNITAGSDFQLSSSASWPRAIRSADWPGRIIYR